MLGDLRILDTGDELLLDTERVALQELFNMIRRFSIGYDVELHKRTLERGLLSLLGPAVGRRGRRRRPAGAPSTRTPPSTIGTGSRRGRSAPTSGSTCCATPSRRRGRCARRSTARARAGLARRRPSAFASSAAAPATGSTSTTP